MTEIMDIENMDTLVDQFVEKHPCKNKDDLAPQWPFRLCTFGSSGAGKTNVIINMIMKQLCFDRIYCTL